MMPHETWYVLEDGSDGRLVHKDGRAVAYAPHGPRSRSVDPAAERSARQAIPKIAEKSPDAPERASSDDEANTSTRVAGDQERELKPQARGRRYNTRDL